ncbi:MAG TPA: hypothetical protein VKS79_11020 [Gemmataceae bacterium]|nr:hypothetical protein [Gemmataceae bacterium]
MSATIRRTLLCAALLTGFTFALPSASRADETDDYINQIYQDQKDLDDYFKSIDDTNRYIEEINEAAQQRDEPEDRDDWLNRIGLGNNQPAGGRQQAAPMNAQQAAAALGFMQQAFAQQQKQLQAMGLHRGLLPGREPNIPAPKPQQAPAVANVARPRPAAVPPAPMSQEELATGKFNMAMMLAKAGKSDAAEDYCKFIMKNYPATAAAKNAQAYLEKPIQ